jgi:hypothetical protein
MFESINNLLPKTFNKNGLGSFFESYIIIKNSEESLKEILGINNKYKYKIKSFKNNSLIIQVDSSIVSSELQIYSKKIIEGINKKNIGNNIKTQVKKIIFKVN